MPRKICVAPGCDDLALPGLSHCEEHEAERQEKLKARRATAKKSEHARKFHALYDEAWRRTSKAYLEQNPLCVDCAELGLIEAATEVDHIEPHRGDRKKFWTRSNWQSLCHSCHSRKTAREVWHRKTGGT